MKKFTLIMLMAIATMTVKAYTYYEGIEIGNFRYNLALATTSSEESKATLQGLSSAGASATSLKIAGYVTYDGNRYRVASIATNAFQYKTSVTSVELGYGVQKIGNNAFKGCEALTSILLPSSISEIGTYAFQNCAALVFVRVAGDVAPAIQDNTFDNSGTTKRVSTATYRGMNALKADSKWVAAFGVSNIKRYNGIATYDFAVGNLHYVIRNGIPYNGTSSDLSKRSTCVIVGADFSSNTTLTINNQASNTANNAPGQYRVYGVADSAFMNNSAVTELKCNFNQASRIGESAFRNCTGLTSVEVTADTIAYCAFYGCSNLTSATLYKEGTGGVEYIGTSAFGYCGMTTVNIPSTTKYIGYAPFYCCSSLEKINVDENNTNYASSTGQLYNKTYTELIQVPGNCSHYSTSYTFHPHSPRLKRVRQYAAAGCNMKILRLTYNITDIDAYAFYNCKNLETVHMPSSLTSVASSAFAGCDKVNRVELNLAKPPTIDYFPAVADKSTVALYTPHEKYDAYANSSIWSQYNRKTGATDHTNCWDFDYHGVYYTVMVPYTGYSDPGKVTVVCIKPDGYGKVKINDEVPNGWSAEGITYSEPYQPVAIGYRVADNSEDFIIEGASTILHINDYAFALSTLTNFPFTNVNSIGAYAFFGCTKLNDDLDATKMSKITEIKDYAFWGSAIKSFTPPTTLETIGQKAFYNCSNLSEIFLPHIDNKHSITCGNNFFGENASDFKCWVDYRRLTDFVNTSNWDTSKIYPFIELDSEWQSFACVKDIDFRMANNNGMNAYIVSDYDQNQKKATLTEVTDLKAKTGAVVHGEIGNTYRLYYPTSGSNTTSSWMVGVTSGSETVVSDNTTSYFNQNATKPQFEKLINYSMIFNRGYAYLKVPTSQTGGVSTIYTNLSEGSETIPGDVNGDGKVNVSDVSTLINMILGLSPMDETRADVNGDNRVNVSDVTALINIILGIS